MEQLGLNYNLDLDTFVPPEYYSAAIYTRFSRDDGDAFDSTSIESQKLLLTKYCEDNGYKVYKIYVDDGYTGLNFDRPDFQRMIRDIEDGKVNMVITKDQSRLGRDYIKTGDYIEKYFNRGIPRNKNNTREQTQVGERLAVINGELNKTDDYAERVNKLRTIANDYADCTELTADMLNKLVERIEVFHAVREPMPKGKSDIPLAVPRKANPKAVKRRSRAATLKTQQINIIYKFINTSIA